MNPQNNCLLTTDASVYRHAVFVLRKKAPVSAPDTASAHVTAPRSAASPPAPSVSHTLDRSRAPTGRENLTFSIDLVDNFCQDRPHAPTALITTDVSPIRGGRPVACSNPVQSRACPRLAGSQTPASGEAASERQQSGSAEPATARRGGRRPPGPAGGLDLTRAAHGRKTLV